MLTHSEFIRSIGPIFENFILLNDDVIDRTNESAAHRAKLYLGEVNNNSLNNSFSYKGLKKVLPYILPEATINFNDQEFIKLFLSNTGYIKIPLSLALKLKLAFDTLIDKVPTDDTTEFRLSAKTLDELLTENIDKDEINGLLNDVRVISNSDVSLPNIAIDFAKENLYEDITLSALRKLLVKVPNFDAESENIYAEKLYGAYVLGGYSYKFIQNYSTFIKDFNDRLTLLYINSSRDKLLSYRDSNLQTVFIMYCKLKADYIQGNIPDSEYNQIIAELDNNKCDDNALSNYPKIIWYITNYLLEPNKTQKTPRNQLNQSVSITDARVFLDKHWGYKKRLYTEELFDTKKWNIDQTGNILLLPSFGGINLNISSILPNITTNTPTIYSKFLWFDNLANDKPTISISRGELKNISNTKVASGKITTDLLLTKLNLLDTISNFNYSEYTLTVDKILSLIMTVGYDDIEEIVTPIGTISYTKDDLFSIIVANESNYAEYMRVYKLGRLINVSLASAQNNRYNKVIQEYISQFIIVRNDEFIDLDNDFYKLPFLPNILYNVSNDTEFATSLIGEFDMNGINVNLFDKLKQQSPYVNDITLSGIGDSKMIPYTLSTGSRFNSNSISFNYITQLESDKIAARNNLINNHIINTHKLIRYSLNKLKLKLLQYTNSNSESFILGNNSNNDIVKFKADTYYNLKDIHDRYISFGLDSERTYLKLGDNIPINTNIDDILSRDLFYAFNLDAYCNTSIGTVKKSGFFYNTLKIVDKGNNDIGHKMYVDLVDLKSILNIKVDNTFNVETLTKTTYFGLLSNIAKNNKFLMHTISTYANFTSAIGNETPQEYANKLFGQHTTLARIDNTPSLVFQLASLTSESNSNILYNPMNTFCMDIDTTDNVIKVIDDPKGKIPTDILDGDGYVSSFIVDFANKNQSMFKNITVSTSEFTNTEESIKSFVNMVSNTAETKAIVSSNNLFNIIQSRSYTAQVTSMLNMTIQPLSYFYLKNVPIFYGSYWITNIKHEIQGNSGTTTFKGVRQPIMSFADNRNTIIKYLADILEKAVTYSEENSGKTNSLLPYDSVNTNFVTVFTKTGKSAIIKVPIKLSNVQSPTQTPTNNNTVVTPPAPIINNNAANITPDTVNIEPQAQVKTLPSIRASVNDVRLIFEERITQASINDDPEEFKLKVLQIASDLRINPNWLMQIMRIESGINTKIKNNINAVGLIQFVKSTAKNLGTDTTKLSTMKGTEQLDYVYKYFNSATKGFPTFYHLYAYTFLPILYVRLNGKDDESVVLPEGTEKDPTLYKRLNKPLYNKVGKTTFGDFKRKVNKILKQYFTNTLAYNDFIKESMA